MRRPGRGRRPFTEEQAKTLVHGAIGAHLLERYLTERYLTEREVDFLAAG